MLRLPLEHYFRKSGVVHRSRIGAVVNRPDYEAYPLGPNCSNVDPLFLHPVVERQFARATVRKISRYRGDAIILGPGWPILEIAGPDQEVMQIDLTVEIKAGSI